MTPAISPVESIITRCPQLRLSDSRSVFPDRTHTTTLPVVVISNARCQATVALQGAQLLTFHTATGQSLLWLSPNAIFQGGKAIRGGIPVCLPWFGPHPSDAQKPQHGFARNREWTMLEAEAVDSGTTRVVWELHYPDWRQEGADSRPDSAGVRPGTDNPHDVLFSGQFRARLIMTLADTIDLELVVDNTGADPFPLSWALHSYHPVSDLATAEISGLEQCHYWDNADRAGAVGQREKKQQAGSIGFSAEVDRLYVDAPSTQCLHSGPMTFVVSAENCSSAIIWNPGQVLAANMTDVGSQHYQEFVCLERGNAAENTLALAPGDTHRARLTICAQNQVCPRGQI